jgi:hypothetical protein
MSHALLFFVMVSGDSTPVFLYCGKRIQGVEVAPIFSNDSRGRKFFKSVPWYVRSKRFFEEG